MKKIFLLLALTMIIFSSCDNYGKKVKISDTLEIYVKGDNVTEKDAKKLGDYLDGLWKDTKNEKSLQLSKEGETYVVRMAVNEEKIKADETADEGFKAIKDLISTNVFDDAKVKFITTDDHFKDLKTY